MAQKVVVELVDDLDGTASDDVSTVTFGLDGVEYQIDLTEDHADRLRDGMADFIAAARRTGGRVRRGAHAGGSGARPAADREQTRVIREWARENGYDLAERGRIRPTNRREPKPPNPSPGAHAGPEPADAAWPDPADAAEPRPGGRRGSAGPHHR